MGPGPPERCQYRGGAEMRKRGIHKKKRALYLIVKGRNSLN